MPDVSPGVGCPGPLFANRGLPHSASEKTAKPSRPLRAGAARPELCFNVMILSLPPSLDRERSACRLRALRSVAVLRERPLQQDHSVCRKSISNIQGHSKIVSVAARPGSMSPWSGSVCECAEIRLRPHTSCEEEQSLTEYGLGPS